MSSYFSVLPSSPYLLQQKAKKVSAVGFKGGIKINPI
jgi:hypothetical protein